MTLLTRRPVLAQLAKDATDDHYPLLVFEDEMFGDFKLTTQFKIVDGVAEQMAGVSVVREFPPGTFSRWTHVIGTPGRDVEAGPII